ncbi:MAG: SusC/RagA family TonB-linked outer membrane protein [Flavobacteriales bacterium]|nr:SusC/RagA family TonB-linked outer membrane protein [Flavobacteriales bacterium]
MKRLYTAITILCIAWSTQLAQAQTVKGTVYDETNQSLPGVVVKDQVSGVGASTNIDGAYSLSLIPGTHTIEFILIGYVTQTKEIKLEAGQVLELDVKLENDIKLTEEVVVVGYGVQRKRDVTGSITKIDGKEMTKVPVPSFEAALQGKGAGIQVSQGSGLAGSGSLVRIRGISSISAGGDPLYVVDGIPVTQSPFLRGNSGAMNNNPLTFLNPNDIESIEVLKDAAATGIYGSRGANGVVLITTKRGKQKGLSVDLSVRVGTSTAASKPNMMTTEEYLAVRQEAWENDGGTGYTYLPGLSVASDLPSVREAKYKEAMKTNTNWFDELTGIGIKQSYNVGVGYVMKNFKMYAGLGNEDNGSYIIGNRFIRNTARLNVDWQVSDKLAYSAGGSYTNSVNHRVDAAWSGGIGEAMSTALPYFPVYDSTGDYYMWNGGNSNPVAYRDLRKWVNVDKRVITNHALTYVINKYWSLRGTASLDYMDQSEMKFLPEGINTGQTQNYAEKFPNWVTNWNSNGTINYNRTYKEDHHVSLMVGSEIQKSTTRGYSQIKYPLLTDLPTASEIEDDTVTAQYGNSFEEAMTFTSVFARFNYSIKDRYYVQVVNRADASSKFGTESKWGNFPSASVGWIMSEESFMKGIKKVNFLKLRASWGITGNADIPRDAQYEKWSLSSGGYNGLPYRYQTQLGNPNLQWENSRVLDAALEVGLLNDRITTTIGVYQKKTTEVLLQYNVQTSTGFTNVWANAGEIKNQGVELTIHSNNLHPKRKLQWTTDLNISRNTNEVVSIGEFTPDALSGGTNDSRVQIGKPVGSFYLVQFAGIDPENGRPMYYDLNGDTTYTYDLTNRQFAGAGIPKAYGGFTNTFNYKNWGLSFFMVYSLGSKIFDSSGKRQMGVVTDWNMRTDVFDRWRAPGDSDTQFAKLTLNENTYGLQTGNPWWNTTLFIFKADYLRLKNVNLSYHFKLKEGSAIRGLAVSLAASNLFVITNFPGLDPELVRDFENAQDRNLSPNVTYLTPPQERSYYITLNANF